MARRNKGGSGEEEERGGMGRGGRARWERREEGIGWEGKEEEGGGMGA